MDELKKNYNISTNITPEFYYLLKNYVKSDDPLEDPKFDCISYLNEKFPDFNSLEKLPNLIEDFEKQIADLDEEIDSLMYERATYNDEMKTYMNELNNDVAKIINLVNTIKQNTDINETTVKMICNDIKNLDNARNNMLTTISSLTKLIMLITGIEKLESFVKEKSFKEAAYAIAASNDIMEYFKEYRHVTQVNQLYQKKDNLCTILLGSILDEFKKKIEIKENSETLYEACLAINAIGDNAIRALKTWFTQYKLTPYEELYDPKAGVEAERRFDWLKRCLKEYNQLYDDIFPPSWGFKSQLCQEFCRITKIHMNEMLMNNLEGTQKIEVETLVNLLNNTINFEKNLHTYLMSDYEVDITKGLKSDELEEIRAKYENVSSQKRNPARPDPNNTPKYSPFRVLGVISETFEPYMSSYVNNEEKKIKQVIDGLKVGDRIEGKLFVSSLYLFNNIKQAMNRCLSFSKSKTFFDLCLKFKDLFKYYNEHILSAKIKFYSMTTTSLDKIRLNDEDLKIICYVINTSDYCITTIGALVDSLKEKIEDKFKNQIHYDDVIDNLKVTYKNSFDLINQNLRNYLESQLSGGMLKMNWVLGHESNSDISQFVSMIIKYFENTFIVIKDILQEEFICHFLNVLPKLMTDILLSNIFKIKKIDETGAQKLLMDVYEFKGVIYKIYTLISHGNNMENDTRLTCLNLIMKKEFGRVESRLKCLGSIVNEIGNAYKTFVTDKSKEDFDKLLLVRGIKRSEITDYEKIFS